MTIHFSRFSLFVFLCLLSPLFVLAQSITEVHFEQFHKPIFETDSYRILQVQLNPGDTSDYHLHDSPIMYISYRETEVHLQKLDTDGRSVTLPNEWIGSNAYSIQSSFTHRIAPIANDSLRIVAFQIKKGFSLVDSSKNNTGYIFHENGFSVSERAGVGNYFKGHSIPLVVRSGNCTLGETTLKKGNVLSKEDFEQSAKKIETCALQFWEIQFESF